MDDIYNGVSHARLSKLNEVFAGASGDIKDRLVGGMGACIASA